MRLGTETVNLVNHLYSRATIGQPRPVVGMGATILCWTDRYAATIHKVTEFCGKNWLYEIEVTADDTTVVSGSEHDGTAKYTFTPTKSGCTQYFRFNRKTQKWVPGFHNSETGKWNSVKGGTGVRIGERDHYIDPSF